MRLGMLHLIKKNLAQNSSKDGFGKPIHEVGKSVFICNNIFAVCVAHANIFYFNMKHSFQDMTFTFITLWRSEDLIKWMIADALHDDKP